jgi:hypothetical protein
MNPTELLTFANEILRKELSLAIAKSAKAASPFQNREADWDGVLHSAAASTTAAPTVTAMMSV